VQVRSRDIIDPKSSQACAEFLKGFHFLLTGHPGDDVPCEAAAEKFLFRIKIESSDQDSCDGGKRVAIEVCKWGKSVASAAHFNHLRKSHFPQPRIFPKFLCDKMPIAGWTVVGSLLKAQNFILSGDKFP